MTYRLFLTLFVLMLVFALPAQASPTSPVASKDGVTFSLEDLSVFWLRDLGKDGLMSFFQTMAIYQDGLKQGLKPTEAEVNEFIENTMSREIYNEFTQLFSERSVRQMVEYTLVTANYETWLRDKIRRDKNITVSESEARDFFLNNIELFHLPEGVHISLISVESQSQADEVMRRLGKGENFNDIAGQVNMDPQMRAASGELGVYRRGEGLPEPIEDAAFNLTPGQHSQIIKGTNYHIVYCHRTIPEISPTFEDVRETLMLDMVEANIDPYYIDELNDLWQSELPRFDLKADLFKPDAE